MKKLLIAFLALGSVSVFASTCKVSSSQLTEIEKETLYRAGIEVIQNISTVDGYYEFEFEKNVFYLTGESQFIGRNTRSSFAPARKQAKASLFYVTKGKYSNMKEEIESFKGSKIGSEAQGSHGGVTQIDVDKKLERYRAKILKTLIKICS